MEIVEKENNVKAETTVQTYVDLLHALQSVQDLPGLKFAQKVESNISKLEERLEPLNLALKPTKEFEEFAQMVQRVAGNDHVKRQELEDQNPEIVEKRVKQLDEAREMLTQPLSVPLRKIHEGELPHNINARQLKGLKLILA